MLHNYPEFYKRVNNKDTVYFSIVYELFIKNLNKASKLDLNNYEDVDKCEEELFNDYHIMIVFSAMTLEAFINDYLAVCLSDNFYSTFDKLTVIQKIETIYSIVWEDTFDKSSELYNRIQALLKQRNLFVHSKSKELDDDLIRSASDDFDEISADEFRKHLLNSSLEQICLLLQEAFSAIQAICLFCKAVDAHDKNRKAVILTMSCITEREIFDYSQKLNYINKSMNQIESSIKKLKKNFTGALRGIPPQEG